MAYLARTSFMLQQGLFVADLAYLLDEGVPSSHPFWGAGLQPAPPEGYDYDTINADVLLNRMTASDDGRAALPDGMSYRALVLPRTGRMRPELLRKIRELVSGGVTVIGPKPDLSPSLQNGAEKADREVQALANEIWGDLDGLQRNTHFFGKGLVTWGLPLSEVLTLANIPRDTEFTAPLDSNVVWIHRRAGDADIYFVVNRTDRPQEIRARFRVDGQEAELWHPDTGAMEPAGYVIAGGRTTVPLHLDARESVFVVFRRPASSPSRTLAAATTRKMATLNGPWDVTFPPGLGAPEKIRLPQLDSWTANSNEGIKYFSGTAAYTKTVLVPQSWLRKDARLVLDLGSVRDIAEVSINGNAVATLWKPPYQVDVTGAIRAGKNLIKIAVTNQWTNRQVGDRAVAPDKRVLAAAPGGRGGFGAAPAISDSGLLGPVAFVLIAAAQ